MLPLSDQQLQMDQRPFAVIAGVGKDEQIPGTTTVFGLQV